MKRQCAPTIAPRVLETGVGSMVGWVCGVGGKCCSHGKGESSRT